MTESQRISLGLLAAAAVLLAGGSALHASLIAHWKLDEGSGGAGTTTVDSADGHDATLSANSGSNPPQWTTDTPDGSNAALEFSSSQQHGVKAPDIEMGGWGEITVAAWIKPNENNNDNLRRVVSKDKTGEAGNFLLWRDSGRYEFQARDDSAGNWKQASQPGSTPTNLGDDQWHHLAGVLRKLDGGGRRLELFVDGQRVDTSPFNASTLSDDDNRIVAIGSDSEPSNHSHVFKGLIDDVRIYDDARDEGEIEALATLIPEPGSLALLAPAGLLALRRRR